MAATLYPGWSTLSKAQAFAIHLTLSLIAFSALVLMMVLYWFPGKLFLVDGGWQGLKLVALVDLVLGPALTLLLYKPGKPKLALDMSMIALFQVSALAYGLVTTHAQRTVAVVYADQAFNTLSNVAYRESNAELMKLERSPQTIKELDASYPALLITPAPTRKNYGTYVSELLNGYPEPHERSDLFITLRENFSDIQQFAIGEEELRQEESYELVQQALKKLNQTTDSDSLELHRFKARYASGIAVFDTQNKKIIDYVSIDPLARSAAIERYNLAAEKKSENTNQSATSNAQIEFAESAQQ